MELQDFKEVEVRRPRMANIERKYEISRCKRRRGDPRCRVRRRRDNLGNGSSVASMNHRQGRNQQEYHVDNVMEPEALFIIDWHDHLTGKPNERERKRKSNKFDLAFNLYLHSRE